MKIDGFRCLNSLELTLEDDLTLIVGENDSGKSSLIECLRIITQSRQVDINDFNFNSKTIKLEIEIDDYIFIRSFERNDSTITTSPLIAKPTQNCLESIVKKLSSLEFDPEINKDYLKETAKTFGLTVRSNSNLTNLKDSILDLINSSLEDGELNIENAKFPNFNNIQLNGKQFENVSSFFKEVFLKEKQTSIWTEKVNESSTIEDFVRGKIQSYSKVITEQIKDRGILEKLKLYLHDLNEIRIEPEFQSRDLNIDAQVRFLENGKEIDLEKKGDGTKRRITMALLEFKKDEEFINSQDNTVYLLDEPDTHLHVKAQLELLNTLISFAQERNQVIMTSHSPFLINAVKPKQIRLLQNLSNDTNIKQLRNQIQDSDKVLQSLGIENLYLFFAKTLIIVEGETEFEFIPRMYLKRTGSNLNTKLIKIINSQGIPNIPGFSKAILELHDPSSILMMYDNDAQESTSNLISALEIPPERRFIIGTKEFEDSFKPIDILNAWKEYLQQANKSIPEKWTEKNITELHEECLKDGLKFSKKLKSLNTCGKKMTKPILGKVLGENVPYENMDQRLIEFFKYIET